MGGVCAHRRSSNQVQEAPGKWRNHWRNPGGSEMSSSFGKFVVRVLAVCTFLMVLGLSIHAQSETTGAIGGTVADAQKKAIAGASVTVRNVATNSTSQPQKTDGNGRYLITNLEPGKYEIEISASNFTSYKQPDVVVEVGLTTPVEVQLGVAGQTQSINVTGEAPVLNTEGNDFTTNINKDSIDNLPLNIRRWSQFALLTPGAVPDGTFGDVSFRGITGLLNNNTVDGGDNNQAYFAEEKGRTRIAYSTSANAIQEFQVNTSSYSAEYGRSAGGVVNAVTKSGGNDYHGDLLYYIRSNSWSAFNPFATAATQTSPGVFTILPIKPLDQRQQIGGDVGGYIWKDKLFWYFNYDDQLHKFPGIAIPSNPNVFFTGITVAAPPGNPVTAGNPTGSGCLRSDAGKADDGTPIALGSGSTLAEGNQLFCRGITQAQTNAGLTFLDGLTGTVPRTGDQGIFFPKLSFKPDGNNEITVSYNRMRWRSPFGIQTSTVVFRGVDSFGDDFVKNDAAVVRWTMSHGSSLTNEMRFQYGRDFEFEFTDPAIAGEPVSALTGLSPQIDINGSASFIFGAPDFLQRAALPDERRYQGADTLAWTHGKHFFKFGVDINGVSDRISNLFQSLGEYSYTDRVDFISDYLAKVDNIAGGTVCSTQNGAAAGNAPIPCYNNLSQGFGIPGFTFTTYDLAFFAQDDWHITRRLTLDLGLRWEKEIFPTPIIPNSLVTQTGTFPSDNKDVGPRVGFAYDLFGTGKTIVRGGFGLYYGRIINGNIFNALVNTGLTTGQVSATIFPTTGSSDSGTPTPGAPLYPNIAASAPAGPSRNIVFFAPDARLPQIDQFDLVVEHQLSANTVVSVSYIGSIGRFLPLAQDINLPAPTTINYTLTGTLPVELIHGPSLPPSGTTFTVPFFAGARPNANFNQMSQISTIVRSYYHAVAFQFNRRMTHGLQFQTSYTFSRALDDDQISSATLSGNTPFDPANVKLDYSPSNFDAHSRLGVSLVWQPEYFKDSNVVARNALSGWTLSPIVVLASGLPFTGTVSGNAPAGTGATTTGEIGASGSSRVPFFARNSFRMPHYFNTDIRLARDIRIREHMALQLSVDTFNLFNNVNITSVNSLLLKTGGSPATPTLAYQSTFGLLSNGNNGTFAPTPRQLQFGARFSF
jgi:carboxypeptidase family protein